MRHQEVSSIICTFMQNICARCNSFKNSLRTRRTHRRIKVFKLGRGLNSVNFLKKSEPRRALPSHPLLITGINCLQNI